MDDPAGDSASVVDALAFQAEAGVLLASSLDYDATLEHIGRLAVPRLADWCAVYVAEEAGVRCASVAHVDPAQREALKEELSRHDPSRDLAQVLHAMHSGRPVTGPDLRRDTLVVPLLNKERPVGALCLYMSTSGRRFATAQEAALGLARVAALALDNATLYRAALHGMRARERVMSIAAHELRSALNVLLLRVQCTQVMCDRGTLSAVSPGWLMDLLQNLEQQGTRMSQLLDQLLDISQINAGRLKLQTEACELGDLVRDLAAQFEVTLTLAGCALEVRADPAVSGTWDRLRIEQVVSNLLGNAVKYGAGRPIEVEVRADATTGTARLSVTDHGSGIAQQDQEHVFKAFWRADSAVDTRGLGLGLSIVRAIVEAHGGTVTVASRLGAGSTFVVELPQDQPG